MYTWPTTVITLAVVQIFTGFSLIHQVGADKGSISINSLDHELVGSHCPTNESTVEDLNQASDVILYSPYTREDITVSYGENGWSIEDVQTIVNNGFNATKPTLLFVHGTKQNSNSSWLLKIRGIYDFLAPNGTEPIFNLMIYNWGNFASFSRAVSYSYAPPLGRILGEFLAKLGKNQTYNFDLLQLVGFSAGNHVIASASRVATRDYAPVGQILVMDASGPCFMDGSEFGDKYGLRTSDAKFMAAKHHAMHELGSKYLIGDVNVLVNGGQNQPINALDVWKNITSPSDLIAMVFASHNEATAYESENIHENCHEMAYECDDYDAYLRGECADCGEDGSKCYLFNDFKNLIYAKSGEFEERPISAYTTKSKMFVKTNAIEPFCLQQYQVVLLLNPSASMYTKNLVSNGLVNLIISDGSIARMWGPAYGYRFTGLVNLSINNHLKDLNTTSLVVKGSDSVTNTFLESIDHVEINYMSHWSAEVRAEKSYRLCPNLQDNTLVVCEKDFLRKLLER